MKHLLRNLVYSFPAFAFAVPTLPVMILLPPLYSEKFGYDIAIIGISIFLARIIDILSDPIMGWICDKNYFSKKIWLIAGGLLSGFALYKLLVVENVTYKEYLFVWISVLYFGWTIFQIPYLSIGYDLEKDYHSRTKLNASREMFILLGLFFSLTFPIFFKLQTFDSLEYLVFIVISFGIISLILFIFLVDEKFVPKKKKNFFQVYKNLIKNKRYVILIGASFINNIANVLPMILFSFFVTDVLGGSDKERQYLLFFYFLFAIIGVPFWSYLSNALEKKKCWILSLILSSAFFIFVLLIGRDDIFLFIIICCLTGFCLGADMFLPPSMQADVTDYHKLRFNEDISGVMFASITFLNKFAFAVGSIFVFSILGFLKFETNSTISSESKAFIYISYALIPVFLKLFSSYLLTKFNSSRMDQLQIQKKIYGN